MSIRILLADDHDIVRRGLRSLIEKQEGMKVVGEVENGREAIRFALAEAPHVVLMDVVMPGLGGIEAARRIVAEAPAIKVLCLSMHRERKLVSAMLEAGAVGYILKDHALEELPAAIRHAAAGRGYLNPSVAATVVADYAAHLSGRPSPASSPLSSREREVLQLLAEGLSSREIAEHLNLSIKTIGSHREKIERKLKIRGVAALTKYAIRQGITTADRDPPV